MNGNVVFGESPNWTAGRDERGHRWYRRTFRTRGSLGLTREDHEAAPGLPRKGDPLDGPAGKDVHAVCLGVDRPLDTSTHRETAWVFTFVYSTDPDASASDVPLIVGAA